MITISIARNLVTILAAVESKKFFSVTHFSGASEKYQFTGLASISGGGVSDETDINHTFAVFSDKAGVSSTLPVVYLTGELLSSNLVIHQ